MEKYLKRACCKIFQFFHVSPKFVLILEKTVETAELASDMKSHHLVYSIGIFICATALVSAMPCAVRESCVCPTGTNRLNDNNCKCRFGNTGQPFDGTCACSSPNVVFNTECLATCPAGSSAGANRVCI